MKKDKNKDDRPQFVFSTNPDFKLPGHDKDQTESISPKDQNLRVWLEKNHRGGKEVSVIRNFVGTKDEMEQLCKTLKAKCGTGGTVKDGEILIQGDQRAKIATLLTQLGYSFKLAGS